MNTPRLDEIITKTQRSMLTRSAIAGLLRSSVILLSMVVTLTLADAMIGFDPTALILLDSIVILTAFLCLVMICRTIYRNRLSIFETARMIEEMIQAPNNRLTNAIALKERPFNHTSESLCREAIVRGESFAGTLDVAGIISIPPLRHHTMIFIMVLLCVGTIYAVFPRVFHATLPRLLQPAGDLPPYTRLTFDVQVLPTPVAFQGPATIRAKISNLPESMRADISLDWPGEPKKTYPMIRIERNQSDPMDRGTLFEFVLNRVDSPLRFCINTPAGRSAWQLILPDTTPKLDLVEVEYTYPEYTRHPVRVVPLTSKGISAIKGTQATVHITANVPLQAGLFILTPNEPTHAPSQVLNLIPDPTEPSHAAVTYRLDEPMHFELTLIGRDGRTAASVLSGPINVIEDTPPTAKILDLDPGTIADPTTDIPIRISARDDMGIRSARLSIQINDQQPRVINLMPYVIPESGTDTLNRIDLPLTISPSRLGAAAGDTIQFAATVGDNHPDPNHTTTTSSHPIRLGDPSDESTSTHTVGSSNSTDTYGGQSTERNEGRTGSANAGKGRVSAPAQQGYHTSIDPVPINGSPPQPTTRLEVIDIPNDAIVPRQGFVPPDTPELYREQAAAYFRRIAEDWISRDN